MKILLTFEATDRNKRNDKGDTALTQSIRAEHTELALILLKDPKTDVNLCGYNNEKPIMIAYSLGMKEVVSYMRDKVGGLTEYEEATLDEESDEESNEEQDDDVDDEEEEEEEEEY